MNFILYLVIAIYFYFYEINCRSLQMDDGSPVVPQARGDVNHDAGYSGIFSWIKLKPILRREVKRITNVKDIEANKLNLESRQTTVSVQPKDDGNLPGKNVHVHINDNIPMKIEPHITSTTTSTLSESGNSRNEVKTYESEVTEEFTSTITDVEMLDLNHSLVTADFSDNFTSDIFIKAEDSILSQDLNVNISTTINPTSFILSELDNNRNKDSTDESDLTEFTSTVQNIEMLDLNRSSATADLSENVILDILNKTAVSVPFQAINDNISTIINPTNSIQVELNNSRNEEITGEADVTEFTSTMKNVEMLDRNHSLATADFSDSVISNILNQTGDSILIEALSDKINTTINSTNSVLSDLDNNRNEETTNESDVTEFTSIIKEIEMLDLNHSLATDNFSDNVISDILNQTSDSVLFQALSDNINTIINSTNSIQSELDNSGNEDTTDESEVVEKFTSIITEDVMLDLNHSLHINDFSDNVISDILNQTGDSIIFQALNENISTINSLEFDETSLLSEGGHVATLQEVSTTGFEFLIDSETRQNLLLTELLTTQSDLTDDDDFYFITLGFNHSNESEVEDSTINEEQTENLNFTPGVVEIENTEFITDDIENENGDLDLTDSVQTVNATEVSSTESDVPKCPDPGWCVFWFMALDTCAKDSHCHGSLICCMVGCSKTCVDAEN